MPVNPKAIALAAQAAKLAKAAEVTSEVSKGTRVFKLGEKMYEFGAHVPDEEIAQKLKAIRDGEESFPALTGAAKADPPEEAAQVSQTPDVEEAFPILKGLGDEEPNASRGADLSGPRSIKEVFNPKSLEKVFGNRDEIPWEEALTYLSKQGNSTPESILLHTMNSFMKKYTKEGGVLQVSRAKAEEMFSPSTLGEQNSFPSARINQGNPWSFIKLKNRSGMTRAVLFHEFMHEGSTELLKLRKLNIIPDSARIAKPLDAMMDAFNDLHSDLTLLSKIKGIKGTEKYPKGMNPFIRHTVLENTEELLAYTLSDPVLLDTLNDVPTLQPHIQKFLHELDLDIMETRIFEGDLKKIEKLSAVSSDVQRNLGPESFIATNRGLWQKGFDVINSYLDVSAADMMQYRKQWEKTFSKENPSIPKDKLAVAFLVGSGGMPGLLEWKASQASASTPEAQDVGKKTKRKRVKLTYDIIRPVILDATVKHGVPMEIALAKAQVETMLYDGWTSSKGAESPWQMKPSIARHYGDKSGGKDWKQTGPAAVAMLADMKKKFKTWPLAWAAYNWGERHVRQHIRKGGTISTMPKETVLHVAKMIKETRALGYDPVSEKPFKKAKKQ